LLTEYQPSNTPTGGMLNKSMGAIFDPAKPENDSAAVNFNKARWGVGVEQLI